MGLLKAGCLRQEKIFVTVIYETSVIGTWGYTYLTSHQSWHRSHETGFVEGGMPHEGKHFCDCNLWSQCYGNMRLYLPHFSAILTSFSRNVLPWAPCGVRRGDCRFSMDRRYFGDFFMSCKPVGGRGRLGGGWAWDTIRAQRQRTKIKTENFGPMISSALKCCRKTVPDKQIKDMAYSSNLSWDSP